jgi:protein O-GlcNAc transferase
LKALGLPELITHSAEEYESLALKLALDASVLAGIKGKLAINRNTHPLFNSTRFACHMEAAYTVMWERYQRGKKPQSFDVEPIS